MSSVSDDDVIESANVQYLAAVGRTVKDPVHDYIKLHPKSWAFVDTRQFQRLRYIKQLGTSYFVWPGASHNRFEHSLGVAYLARLQVLHLQRAQPELEISDRDVECVELAGLCHDLGHGPLSHVWDSQFLPRALAGNEWKHEKASQMMFDYLRADNGIQMSETDANFIKALIDGCPQRCDPKEKSFLFEIVANKRNGIDVDKLDYIARDTHAIGEKINISSSRLIHSARVIDNQICYDIKDANTIYEMFHTRFSLHKRLYSHKTARAIEYMVVDALLAAEPRLKLAEQIMHPEKFVNLTDDVLLSIERSAEPELKASRDIFERLRVRDLYKYVDYKILPWHLTDACEQHVTPARIVEAAKLLAASSNNADVISTASSLDESHIIVGFSTLHYGMKEKNPMETVKFYSKRNPNQCAQAGPGDFSTLMPAVFAEGVLRVYTRQARYFGIIQAGYRHVIQNMPTLTGCAVIDDVSYRPTTPTATDGPSTPRVQSRNASLSDIALASVSLSSVLQGHTAEGMSPYKRNNSFTTVAPNFAPASPTAGRVKRCRNGSVNRNGPAEIVDGDGESGVRGKRKRRNE